MTALTTSGKPPEASLGASANTRRRPEVKPLTSGAQKQHPEVSLRSPAAQLHVENFARHVHTSGGADVRSPVDDLSTGASSKNDIHSTSAHLRR